MDILLNAFITIEYFLIILVTKMLSFFLDFFTEINLEIIQKDRYLFIYFLTKSAVFILAAITLTLFLHKLVTSVSVGPIFIIRNRCTMES